MQEVRKMAQMTVETVVCTTVDNVITRINTADI